MSERQFNEELEKIWKEVVVGLLMYLTGNNWRVEEDQDKHQSEYLEVPAENRTGNLRKMTLTVLPLNHIRKCSTSLNFSPHF